MSHLARRLYWSVQCSELLEGSYTVMRKSSSGSDLTVQTAWTGLWPENPRTRQLAPRGSCGYSSMTSQLLNASSSAAIGIISASRSLSACFDSSYLPSMTRRRIAPATSPPRSLLKEPSPIRPFHLTGDIHTIVFLYGFRFRAHPSFRTPHLIYSAFQIVPWSVVRGLLSVVRGRTSAFRLEVVPSSAFGLSCCYQLARLQAGMLKTASGSRLTSLHAGTLEG